jgi:hypothetical protein
MANLQIADIDFDDIKLNLKTFLKAQNEFLDYDFEGSGLSVLLDVLAYNTHYNAYIANMLANEMFLDSAVKRTSAVSIAKHLGYTPRSARGAVANINVVVTNPTGLPSTLTLDKYSTFTSSINSKTYTFLNTEAYTANRVGTTYTFNNVSVKEGAYLTFTYTITDAQSGIKYEIPNENVDTTTIRVTVQNSIADLTTYTYTLCDDISVVDSQSTVYFLDENTLGKYEIYFGDDVISKALSVGNIVTIEYMVVSGSAANVGSSFTQSFSASGVIGGSSSITVTVNTKSTGAADQESISSIKYLAPKYNAARSRAVTEEDYGALILANFAEVESVNVWGGEENVPQMFGKIVISLKPYDGYNVSSASKETIKNTILKNKKVVTITPEFVDPQYIYVNIAATAKYYQNRTTQTNGDVVTGIYNTINTYFSTNLGKFNQKYYNSALSCDILDANTALASVDISLKLQNRINLVLSAFNNFTNANAIFFRNSLIPGSLTSSYFYVTVGTTQTLVKIIDIPNQSPPSNTGDGTLKLVNSANAETIIDSSFGTINYSTGEVSITGFTPIGFQTGVTDLRLNASVQDSNYDLTLYRNEIFLLDDTEINLSAGRNAGTSVTATAIV